MKTKILLKITGELFLSSERSQLSNQYLIALIEQIQKLRDTHQFGIVVGGGNFFRGSIQGKQLGLSAFGGHQIGMLATVMNGLILKDLFNQYAIPATVFCAQYMPEVGQPINQQNIDQSLNAGHVIIFVGGTGNPYFTTDTTAIVRSLQMNACAIWKGTSVDGIYTADPRKNAHATFLPTISYHDALAKQLGIMDTAAYALAQDHALPIRIFNIFLENALINAAHNKQFGSTII
jgi:uridylate kinase